jgi:hypothetical protein
MLRPSSIRVFVVLFVDGSRTTGVPAITIANRQSQWTVLQRGFSSTMHAANV